KYVGDKPRVFIDISLPQALDPKLGELEQKVYYCVDDINAVIEDNKDKRKYDSSKAQKIIVKSLEESLEKEKAIISNSAIKELFQKADG
ncbi:glutamyl-tRNA reductase, partial [Francisella tularensis subsp. holarctica]|nr:glutamyl-tRNA reductase [Francisella tularensis subsp. holarctica]